MATQKEGRRQRKAQRKDANAPSPTHPARQCSDAARQLLVPPFRADALDDDEQVRGVVPRLDRGERAVVLPEERVGGVGLVQRRLQTLARGGSAGWTMTQRT